MRNPFTSRNERAACQDFLEILGVQDGIIIWSDGTYSLILRISTINIELRNDDEKLKVMNLFRRFLDQLRFPLQITIRKRIHPVDDYLRYLQACTQRTAEPEILRTLGVYHDFIEARAQAKEFYEKELLITLSYGTPVSEMAAGGILSILPFIGRRRKRAGSSNQDTTLQVASHRLNLMAGTIQQGLQPLGLTAEPLDTEDVLRLYYSIYADERYTLENASGELSQRLSVYTGIKPGIGR